MEQMHTNRLYISFRNSDGSLGTYMSPDFQSRIDFGDSEVFDNPVSDGDEDTGFCISCDMELHNNNIFSEERVSTYRNANCSCCGQEIKKTRPPPSM